MEKFDVIVIGGGPGGYVAAVKSRQLGFKTALVEKECMGGTCLNWGCVPTKALLHSAEVVHLLSKGRTHGFSFDNLTIDYAVAHKRSRSIVKRQTARVNFLMKSKGVAIYNGSGSLLAPDQVKIEPSGEVLTSRNVILATGSGARPLPGIEYNGETVIQYRKALELTRIPDSALIVGAGPIGVEFATIWNRYGTKVTLVEARPHVLPLEDEDISDEAFKSLKQNKIHIRTGTQVEKVTPGDKGVDVILRGETQSETLTVETILVSIGVVPNNEGLNLETVGVESTRGNVRVNEQMRTSIDTIYAIGDMTGIMPLAHVASAQGIIAIEAIAGKITPPLHYANIPRCTYAQPEIASVGLTEKQAKEKGYDVITARSPFVANGKAIAIDDNSGFVKIIACGKTNKLLGVHLIGGHVTELVAGPAGMINLETGLKNLENTIHPHPTLSESIMEAAHALLGHAIHT